MFQITRKYPGAWIVQAEGLISIIDQAFYFRASNGRASLTISPDSMVKMDRDACAFVEIEVPEVNFGNVNSCGYVNITDAEVDRMITTLLTTYFKEAVRAHSIVYRTGDQDRLAS